MTNELFPKNNIVSLEDKRLEKDRKKDAELSSKMREIIYGQIENPADAAEMLVNKYEAMVELEKARQAEKPPKEYYTNEDVSMSYDDRLRDQHIEDMELLKDQWREGTPDEFKGGALEELFDQGRFEIVDWLAKATDVLKCMNIRQINKIEKKVDLHQYKG